MIIFNTTFVLHNDVAIDVLQWIRAIYLPAAHGSACADTNARILRIIDNPDPDTVNYAVQFAFTDIDNARDWHEGTGRVLTAKMSRMWHEKALSFSTLMEVVD